MLNQESGPFDVLVLQFIHANVAPSLTELFEAATISGSAWVLLPLVISMVVALLCAKRRFEALLITVSVLSGSIIVYVLKAAVGRARAVVAAHSRVADVHHALVGMLERIDKLRGARAS